MNPVLKWKRRRCAFLKHNKQYVHRHRQKRNKKNAREELSIVTGTSASATPNPGYRWRRFTCNWARERANAAFTEATSSDESFSLKRSAAR